jgi:hypothetical protein
VKLISSDKKIDDQYLFIKLITNCLNLETLKVENSGLKQSFFDQLPSISSLNKLVINESEMKNLNFRFITRMFRLEEIDTSQVLYIEEDWEINRLRYLKRIGFEFNGTRIVIEKIERNSYRLFYSKNAVVVYHILNSRFFIFMRYLKPTFEFIKLLELFSCLKKNKKHFDQITNKNKNYLKITFFENFCIFFNSFSCLPNFKSSLCFYMSLFFLIFLNYIINNSILYKFFFTLFLPIFFVVDIFFYSHFFFFNSIDFYIFSTFIFMIFNELFIWFYLITLYL